MKEKEASSTDQNQAAMYELLQEMQALRSATQQVQWTTKERQQELLRLEEACRLLKDHVKEGCKPCPDPRPDVATAQTPFSPEALAERETVAGEVPMPEEVTGKHGFCREYSF